MPFNDFSEYRMSFLLPRKFSFIEKDNFRSVLGYANQMQKENTMFNNSSCFCSVPNGNCCAKGDSGGPLFYERPDKTVAIIGVTVRVGSNNLRPPG